MNSKPFYFLILFCLPVLFLSLTSPGEALKKKTSMDSRYVDNGDGTITDYRTDLMWTKKDSYADLKECRNWYKSKKYVDKLKTGGYSDWRMPTAEELETIFERSKSNKNYLGSISRLDPIFASAGTWWYWLSETVGPCCAKGITFDNGKIGTSLRRSCSNGGVRAVRLGD